MNQNHVDLQHGDSLATADAMSWQLEARCARTDPETFFPGRGGPAEEARRFCRSCRVRDECLNHAITHDLQGGIWGGMTRRERIQYSAQFATRLNKLFDRWALEHGARLTNSELVRRLAQQGHLMSKPYLSQLRNGRRRQPSEQLLLALARVFDVPVDYFAQGDTAVRPSDAALVSRVHPSGLRRLLIAAAGLSQDTLDELNQIAAALRQAEQLPQENHSATW